MVLECELQVERRSSHCVAVSSLRASTCAHGSHACCLSSCLERQLVPLEVFYKSQYMSIYHAGRREGLILVKKCSFCHGMNLSPGGLLSLLVILHVVSSF